MNASNRFLIDFGLTRPILQAPIGSLATVELVAAVSNAGGMGSLALTWTEPDIAAKLISTAKRLTRKSFFANFVLAFPPKSLNAALEAGVPVVTFSWGLPGRFVALAHSHGTRVGVQVASPQGAQRAIDEGCDFLVCQGMEGGGHVQSSIPLHELLPAVLAVADKVPVVATGGLADGKDIAQVLKLGASGAMLGTRFVASEESRAHPQYKQALVAASAQSTVLTGCFERGWPYAAHRVLRNSTLTEWEAAGCPPVGHRPGESDVIATTPAGLPVLRYMDTPPSDEMRGDVLACCLYAGAGVDKINEVRPAASLVDELWAAAITALRTPS